MHRSRTAHAALLVIIAAGLFYPAAAQSDKDAGVARFSVSTNLVKVPISVFDERGLMAGNLRKEDFRLWENQAQQEIRSLSVDSNSVSALLVLDTSPSSKSELSKMKSAAETFAGKLGKDDRISIITFDENVRLILDWTSDTKQAKRALAGIKPGLRTALYDAMYLAAIEQMRGIEGHRAIILLTDCVNNHSRIGFEEATHAVAKSQASFYLISKTTIMREQARQERRVVIVEDIYKRMFGEELNYVDEYFDKREKDMTDLAESTGGRVFFPRDYNSIKSVYAEIARELKNKYYLTYVSNQNLTPDSWYRIAVEYLRPASEVLYRQGYYYLPEMQRKAAGPVFAPKR
jgi:Ca-activated chloride channel family protein